MLNSSLNVSGPVPRKITRSPESLRTGGGRQAGQSTIVEI